MIGDTLGQQMFKQTVGLVLFARFHYTSTVFMAFLVREQHQVLTAVINCLAFYLGLITPSKHHFRPSEQTRRTSLRLVRLSEVASL